MKGRFWSWTPCSENRYKAQKTLAELHEKEGKTDLTDWTMAKFNRYFKCENGKFYEYTNSGTFDTEHNQIVR